MSHQNDSSFRNSNLEAFREELYRILLGLILPVVGEVIRQCLPPTQKC